MSRHQSVYIRATYYHVYNAQIEFSRSSLLSIQYNRQIPPLCLCTFIYVTTTATTTITATTITVTFTTAIDFH